MCWGSEKDSKGKKETRGTGKEAVSSKLFVSNLPLEGEEEGEGHSGTGVSYANQVRKSR